MIVIYTPGASIDNGAQGPDGESFPAMTCLLITLLEVNRVAIGRNQSRRSFVLGASKWDGGSGFRCTTTIPAPKKNCFSYLP